MLCQSLSFVPKSALKRVKGHFQESKKQPKIKKLDCRSQLWSALSIFGWGILLLAIITGCQSPKPSAADLHPAYHIPKPDIKVLVFSKTAGFRHKSIPHGIKAFESICQDHHFSVIHSEEAGLFNDQDLTHFDAVVFLNTSGDIFNDEQQAAFQRFIERGGGFVGVHAAADTEHDWPWYGQLLGAAFVDHPKIQDARIEADDRCHPATFFLDQSWLRRDEWYNLRYFPDNKRVLLNLDENSYQGGSSGAKHPIAWVKDTDTNRVFYTAMGHTPASYRDPMFLKHLEGGLLYVLSDRLKTPVTDPPLTALSPDMSCQCLKLPPGFRAEVVAAEPLIEEPIAMTWDADGRMFVVELRQFMMDLHGSGEKDPVGRVVRLEDLDGDGVMDKSQVFLDGLVEPRAVYEQAGKVLIAEPPFIWLCEDHNDDGIADSKIEVFSSYSERESSSVEHKDNGLVWAIDNWIHNADSPWKFQLKGKTLSAVEGSKRGQWGLGSDDEGRLYYSHNRKPFLGEQISFDYFPKDDVYNPWNINSFYKGTFKEVWPIIKTLDSQDGPVNLRDDGRLISFTCASGQTVYRGHRMPFDFDGNLFIADAVGRLVRRGVLQQDRDGLRRLVNPYESYEGEFLSSRDPNFRPVSLANGPDGCLYVVDMYRSLIQHKQFLQPGSYLYQFIKNHGYEQNVGRGRIYRIVHDDYPVKAPLKMSQLSPDRWCDLLSHPSGWVRDKAQALLVDRADHRVVTKLTGMLKSHPKTLTRLHALWTLQGLESLTSEDLLAVMDDPDPKLLRAALQISEQGLDESLQTAFFQKCRQLGDRDDFDLHLQLILTLGRHSFPESPNLIAEVVAQHPFTKIMAVACYLSHHQHVQEFLETWSRHPATSEPMAAYADFMVSQVVKRADPVQMLALFKMLPSLDKAEQSAYLKRVKTALQTWQGAVEWPVALAEKPPLDDHALSGLETYFTWPETAAEHSKPQPKPWAADRKERFKQGMKIYRQQCSACHGQSGEGVSINQRLFAPKLKDSPRVLGDKGDLIRIMLHGLQGPIDGQHFGDMPALGHQDDEWIASILTFVRRTWGHRASGVAPAEVSAVRKQHSSRSQAWTLPELEAMGP